MIDVIRIMNPNELIIEKKIRVMIADDHPLVRDSLNMHLKDQPDIEIVGEAEDGLQAVQLAGELLPDVIIMDISMPRLNGLDAIRKIKTQWPDIEVLVLTVHDDTEHILKILEAGATGYLTKNILGKKLIHAIHAVMSGESIFSDEIKNRLLIHALRYPLKPAIPTIGEILTAREMEIFQLVARGMSNKQIAQEMNLNLRTVKGHFVSIFSKLNVNSRTEALVTGLRIGLITLDDIK
jgi:two-component system, NarL family, response regulator LiaR